MDNNKTVFITDRASSILCYCFVLNGVNVICIGVRFRYDEGKHAFEFFCMNYYCECRVGVEMNTYGFCMPFDDGRVVLSDSIVQVLVNNVLKVYGCRRQPRNLPYVDDHILEHYL